MRKIEAVIFDWAGTTVDYGSFAPVQAFIAAFKKFGITPTNDEVRKPMGIAKIDHVREMLKMERISYEWKNIHGRNFTEDDVKKIYELSESLILDILKDFSEPKPYVLDAVSELRKKGIKIGSTTGYNNEMMEIVKNAASEKGYSPDTCFTPDSINKVGRPYPYLIFKNMMELNIKSVDSVVKVGDTVADIAEGKNAGVITVGIIEGSSVLGYSEAEYAALGEEEKLHAKALATEIYKNCGADYILDNMGGLIDLINSIEKI
ncbi:MAG: phosphonoacetaldehyde hydrolase [Clostridia bacterium]|nr:phosphonoacetaldehyde hydrolase [Clostridia bacterium]